MDTIVLYFPLPRSHRSPITPPPRSLFTIQTLNCIKITGEMIIIGLNESAFWNLRNSYETSVFYIHRIWVKVAGILVHSAHTLYRKNNKPLISDTKNC